MLVDDPEPVSGGLVAAVLMPLLSPPRGCPGHQVPLERAANPEIR